MAESAALLVEDALERGYRGGCTPISLTLPGLAQDCDSRVARALGPISSIKARPVLGITGFWGLALS